MTEASAVEIVQTIEIKKRGNLWFATSEDEPFIFICTRDRISLNTMLAHVLTDPKRSEKKTT